MNSSLDVCEGLSEFDRKLLGHPLLSNYWPSERRAIVEYAIQLRAKLERPVDIPEAVTRWENGAGAEWRHVKMRVDGQRQLKEIERHKYIVSQKCGYDVGWENAADEWIARHAGNWRNWWEDQDESCP